MLEIEEHRRLEVAISTRSPDDPLHAEGVNKTNDPSLTLSSTASVFESFFTQRGDEHRIRLAKRLLSVFGAAAYGTRTARK